MKLLMLGGIAGPVLFSLLALVCGVLRTDYNHLNQFISELGASGTPHAAVMNYAGFVPAGLMIAAFGLAFAMALPKRRLIIIAAALVALFGLGVAASGVISCDPGCPETGTSRENLAHNLIGPIAFLCLISATGVFGAGVRRVSAWRSLSTYSLVTCAVAFGLFVALVSSLDTRALTGLWQRLLLATLFLWCGIVGWRASHSETIAPSAH